jgi:hypothetical protein
LLAIAANDSGLLPWRTSNLMNVPAERLKFSQARREASRSHGSKPPCYVPAAEAKLILFQSQL